MMLEEQKLDNPVWHSLSETHRDLGLEYDGIKFYHPDFCPFGGFKAPDQTLAGIDQYALLTNNLYVVGDQPDFSNQLQLRKELICNQMIITREIDIPVKEKIIELGEEHRNDLFELVNLVQPGYFRANTYQMGRYYGIYLLDHLIAVTGERMKMNAFTEISAVVTHPEHTGKGYARQLIAHASKNVFKELKTPYLHVLADNTNAIHLYLKIGFIIRRQISFWNLATEQ